MSDVSCQPSDVQLTPSDVENERFDHDGLVAQFGLAGELPVVVAAQVGHGQTDAAAHVFPTGVLRAAAQNTGQRSEQRSDGSDGRLHRWAPDSQTG